MKKSFCSITRGMGALALCFTFNNSAFAAKHHAQSYSAPSSQGDYAVGAELGLNFTSIGLNNPAGVSVASGNATGFTLGAVGDLRVYDSFFVSSGLIYSNRGINSTDTGSSISLVSIPIHAKYRFENLSQMFIPYAFAGPTIDFGMASSLSPSLISLGYTKKAALFGFDIGIGTDYMLQDNISLGLDLLYHFNFGSSLNNTYIYSGSTSYGSGFSAFEIAVNGKWHF